MRVRISTASGSERDTRRSSLATARGTDPASLPVYAIVNRSSSIAKAKDLGLREDRRFSWLARMSLFPLLKNFFDFGAGPRIDVPRAVFAAAHHLAFELFGVNRVLGGLDHFVGELRREKQHPLFVADDDITRQDRYLADANWRVPF